MTTPAMTELPEPELGYIETDKSRQPAFSARQMREALQSAQQAAAVSDEPELTSKVVNDACWKFVKVIPHALPGPIWNDLKPAMYAALMHYHRAILALRPQAESKTYSDGTTATGPAPLPDVSPAEQDASLAESLLTDLESMLGGRNGASIKLRSLIRSLRQQSAIVGRTIGDGSGQAVIYDTTLPDSTPLYAGSNSQAVPMTPASRAVIMATRTADGDADEWPEPWAYRRGWNDAEEHHHIRPNAEAK